LHSHGRARGSKFQLPNNVRLVLYNGKDEGSTYAEPRSPEEYEKLISDESGSELHCLEKCLLYGEGPVEVGVPMTMVVKLQTSTSVAKTVLILLCFSDGHSRP